MVSDLALLCAAFSDSLWIWVQRLTVIIVQEILKCPDLQMLKYKFLINMGKL